MEWSTRVSKLGDSSLTIGGDEIPIKHGELEQSILKFYAENPRLYSVLESGSEKPDQGKIQRELLGRDHVKRLKKDIKANGGLLEPVIIRDRTFEVLEGNSRLAAYRDLVKKDPRRWGKIKCQILPGDIDDSHIFTILGQLHIRGKQDWDKYEQAGYLWRRHYRQEVPIAELATQIGLSATEVKKQIATYQFMQEYQERNIKKWSYYEVYLGNRAIQKARKEYSDFDDLVVEQIQDDRVGTAQEFRLKLGEVAKHRKILKDYANKRHNLDASYQRITEKGLTSDFGRQLKRFRSWATDSDRKKELRQHIDKSKVVLNETNYSVGKIANAVKAWEGIIDKKK